MTEIAKGEFEQKVAKAAKNRGMKPFAAFAVFCSNLSPGKFFRLSLRTCGPVRMRGHWPVDSFFGDWRGRSEVNAKTQRRRGAETQRGEVPLCRIAGPQAHVDHNHTQFETMPLSDS